jgi:hypothetical protein
VNGDRNPIVLAADPPDELAQVSLDSAKGKSLGHILHQEAAVLSGHGLTVGTLWT